MMEEKRKKRIRYITIVFFVIMALITFFSNTIRNYALPIVKTQRIISGEIINSIKEIGVVQIKFPTEVVAYQDRVILEVAVQKGDMVQKNQVLYYLDKGDETKWKEAEKELEALETNYRTYLLSGEIPIEAYNNVVNQQVGSKEEKQALLFSLEEDIKKGEESVRYYEDEVQKIQVELSYLQNGESSSSSRYQEIRCKLIAAENELEKVRDNLEILKKKKDERVSVFQAEIDLQDYQRKIEEQEREVQQLKEENEEKVIAAPEDGKIMELVYRKGETVKKGEKVAIIHNKEAGFCVSLTVPKQQIEGLQIGDKAEVTGYNYDKDIDLILSDIQVDNTKGEGFGIVTFDVEGEVSAGQTISMKLEKQGKTYDMIVPNSAVREDISGAFVLVLESQNTSLGNRYIANRVDVTILERNEKFTAIEGALYGGENVITSFSKPVENLQQVRIAN